MPFDGSFPENLPADPSAEPSSVWDILDSIPWMALAIALAFMVCGVVVSEVGAVIAAWLGLF